MSGVRVQNPRLLALGLTLPGFVDRGKVIASLPSLGLLTLAAHTPGDWECVYREYDELPESSAETIAGEDFVLVAISSLTARIDETYRLAEGLRRNGVFVVLGGLHASALPGEAAAHVNTVIVGEGELIWRDFLADFDAGSPRPLYDTRLVKAGPEHFHQQPIPRYDLLDITRYNRLTLQTTRGCPLHCSFCAASRLISPYRKKAHDQIRRELAAILDLWPRPFIELADDNTFVDKSWGLELAAILGEHHVRWFTETDISIANDRNLLRALARSGCAQVLIGLEAADANTMRGLDSRDWKAKRHEAVRESIRGIQGEGISVNGCFILGFDQDDAGSFQRTLDYIDTLGLAEVQITLLTPFPGTALREGLERDGRILPNAEWSQYTLFDVTFHPAQMSAQELEEGFAWLMGEVYSAERVRHRKSVIKQTLLKRK